MDKNQNCTSITGITPFLTCPEARTFWLQESWSCPSLAGTVLAGFGPLVGFLFFFPHTKPMVSTHFAMMPGEYFPSADLRNSQLRLTHTCIVETIFTLLTNSQRLSCHWLGGPFFSLSYVTWILGDDLFFHISLVKLKGSAIIKVIFLNESRTKKNHSLKNYILYLYLTSVGPII